MTLNITLLTRTRIFQSSDFRLSANGNLVSSSTMKLITLHYYTFSGFISYTGIAKRDVNSAVDTGGLIVDWLQGRDDIAFHEAVEIVRAKASEYVTEIAKQTGVRHKLTLIAAAFHNDNPTVAVVSNFESIDGREDSTVSSELRTSWSSLRPGRTPRVIVTGCKKAVPLRDRKRLEDLALAAGEDSARIRVAIEDLNRDAARRPGWTQLISENCTVVSLDSSGNGSQDIPRTSRVVARSLINGQDMESLLRAAGLDAGVVAGATFATNKTTTRRPAQCKKTVIDIAESGFTVLEIEHKIDGDCQAFGIDSVGLVFGASSLPDDRTMRRYWIWDATNGKKELDYWSSDTGGAISENGQIALLNMIKPWENAPVLISGTSERLLEVPHGMGEPEITAINSDGVVAGAISITLDRTAANRVRPAVWDVDGSIRILDRLCGAENGRVVSISDRVALVWANQGLWGRVTIIWDLITDEVKQLPGSIIPLHVDSQGRIIGIASAHGGQQFPIVSLDHETWASLPPKAGFEPTAANSNLVVGGRVKMDGYYFPWFAQPGSMPQILSTFEYHSHGVRAINGNGLIIGQASTDREHHILLWKPPTA
ncbi:hypothetical protein ACFYOK_35490 [Microbispora bryophytorum]|uniref:hypothetical protein n=1 Tax=Microbispora bryophytorum TaxID=1460882 RepID=UPI0034074A96